MKDAIRRPFQDYMKEEELKHKKEVVKEFVKCLIQGNNLNFQVTLSDDLASEIVNFAVHLYDQIEKIGK